MTLIISGQLDPGASLLQGRAMTAEALASGFGCKKLRLWGISGSSEVRGSHRQVFGTLGLDSVFLDWGKAEQAKQEEERDEGPNNTVLCGQTFNSSWEEEGKRGSWRQWSSVLLKLMTALCSKYFVKSSLLSWNKMKFMGNITPAVVTTT